MKTCIDCGELKTEREFEVGRNQCRVCRTEYMVKYNAEYYAENKDKMTKKSAKYYAENKDEIAKQKFSYNAKYRTKDSSKYKNYLSTLKCTYKISEQFLRNLMDNQRGLCAVCKRSMDHMGTPCIDHCHSIGSVRGLLCGHCNRMLGHSKDNPTTLREGANYLEEHNV